MLNNRTTRILFCLLYVIACSFALLGCSEENPNGALVTYPENISTTQKPTGAIVTHPENISTTQKPTGAIVTYPENISAIADFKCVCSTDHETEFVIENDDAKVLYTYIMEQWKKAEETEIDRTEQDDIYLSFQGGEPLLILSQEPNAEISDALAVSDEHFYGVFWIHENDYMVFTAMPITSFQKYYKMPEGTYDKIAELVTK